MLPLTWLGEVLSVPALPTSYVRVTQPAPSWGPRHALASGWGCINLEHALLGTTSMVSLSMRRAFGVKAIF